MGKTRRITPAHIEILREIEKHPHGTPPGIIYKNFDSQTWEVLRKPNRNNEEILNAGEVFQLLCTLVKNPKIFEKENEPEKQEEIKPEMTSPFQDELNDIIEEAMISFNSQIQYAVEDIGQKVFNKIKDKLYDITKQTE
ncbi:hypothetical protein [Rummeliibacillus pycnus]|uniref:hypothetical protein n=1 Tax=Rummeliibacillus pycnus TaxID=101070 RepID=UPI003D2E456C